MIRLGPLLALLLATPGVAAARENPVAGRRTIEEFLLGSDFTVVGRVKKGFHPGDTQIAVQVDEVLLGAIPKRTIELVARPARGLKARDTVLACGTWVGASRGRCAASLWRVRSDGSVVGVHDAPRASEAPHDERSEEAEAILMDQPGFLDGLRGRLRQEARQNPVGWLTSGPAIGLARIVEVKGDQRAIRVTPVARLAGSGGSFPTSLTWRLARCRFVPTVGDSVLLPLSVSPADSVVEAPCLDRLSVTWYTRNPLGVSLGDIHRIVAESAGRLRVRPIHGVPLERIAGSP